MKTDMSHKHARMHALINIKGNAHRWDNNYRLPKEAAKKYWYKPVNKY